MGVPIPPLCVDVDPMVGRVVGSFVAEPLDVDSVVPPPVPQSSEASA